MGILEKIQEALQDLAQPKKVNRAKEEARRRRQMERGQLRRTNRGVKE